MIPGGVTPPRGYPAWLRDQASEAFTLAGDKGRAMKVQLDFGGAAAESQAGTQAA